MQQVMQPQPLRLQWVPVNPSWIVSIGLIILAALPHNVPEFGRRLLSDTIVRVLFAGAAIYIGLMNPVLGTAMLIFLASTVLFPISEGFVVANLNKDYVQPKKRKDWLGEELMSEDPHGIQDLTSETNLNFDSVPENKPSWIIEKILGEHPTAIQDKPVPEFTINRIGE
jgi:hypothetical protein